MTTSTKIVATLYPVRRRHSKELANHPPPSPVRRPARVAIMLAFAHRARAMLDEGRVASQVEVAQRLGITPARLSQLLDLTWLAPEIQERLLLMEAVDNRQPLLERSLRTVIRFCRWSDQRPAFEAVRKGAVQSGRVIPGHPAQMVMVGRIQISAYEQSTVVG